MASMLDNIRELITPAMLTRAAALTGASESALTAGFGAAIPRSSGTVAKRSGDTSFMTELGRLALGASSSDPLTAAKAFTVARDRRHRHHDTDGRMAVGVVREQPLVRNRRHRPICRPVQRGRRPRCFRSAHRSCWGISAG